MREYDKDFKQEAIKLSYELGPTAASEKLGIPVTTLYSWINRSKRYGEIAFVGSGHKRVDPKTAEIKAMEKKIKDLEVANDILKRALGFFAESQNEIAARELFHWIWLHKTREKTKHSIKTMCRVLQVSEAGYYKWLKRQSKPYKYEELLAKILQIRADNPDYGAYRIYLHLKLYLGYTGSYYLILKLCKTHHLMLKRKHNCRGITKADLAAQASANLIKQDFSAASPNQKWLGDVTEIPTADGKLYLAAVLDCFDGSIVGFKMANHMRAELCVEAFTSGVKRYHAYGMIFHSDRGSQVRQEVA